MLIKKLFNLFSREDDVCVDLELISILPIAQVITRDDLDESKLSYLLACGAIGVRLNSEYRKLYIDLVKETGTDVNYFTANKLCKEIAHMCVNNGVRLKQCGVYDDIVDSIKDIILTCMFSDVIPVVKKEVDTVRGIFDSIKKNTNFNEVNISALKFMISDYCECMK